MYKLKAGALIGLAVTLGACGGGGGGGGGDIGGNDGPNPPPPPPTEAYTVTLTAVGIDRIADQQALDVDGLPVAGATVTVD
jgi:hypothetical protein